MTLKTIELASLEATQELVIPEGTIATYDAAQGTLAVGSIVNHGTLRILSTSDNQEAVIAAPAILNTGSIESDLPILTFKAAAIKGAKKGGVFSAAELIRIESAADIKVLGGIFVADVLQLNARGKVGVHAYRIDAKVKVKAKEVAVGANDGNLEIIEQEIDGDPLYYQGKDTNGGNMTISVMNQPGEDVSLWAVGNITVNGPINTLGGDDQHIGRITIVGGQQKVAYNGVENDGIVPCVDCSLPFPGLEIVTTPLASNTSVITTGNLSGKAVGVEGGTIVTGDVYVDNENIALSRNLAGQCGFTAATSVKTGTVKVVSRDGGNVGKGGMTAFAGQNMDIGNVDGSVILLSDHSGLIKVGNVDGGSVIIKAGQDFGGGGGGIIGGAAIQSLTTLDAKIQTGTLKAKSSILLMANGTIGTGAVTLDEYTLPGVPHDVRIHANINKETTVPFLAGGGGTNGTGIITVNKRTVLLTGEKAGTIAISNGPTGDVHANGGRLRCLTGTNGTPGIVIDAGTGQIRLVGANPLSVDGDASNDAGFVILMGGELRAPNAAIISASDTKGTAETEAPTVILAVDKITLPGSLTVNCNGNTGTSVKMAPKGSESLDIVHTDYTVAIKPTALSPVAHELAITGAGSLSISAHSQDGQVFCSGDPLRFANSGATLIESERDGSLIEITFAGGPSGQDSLIFTGGSVEISADNPQHDGGTIMVTADKVKNTASSVSMHANALADGAGGSISLDIDRGNLALGTAAGTMSLAATGMGSGAGGSISVENAQHNGTITLDTTFSTAAVNVAALGSNGDGGTIDLHADHLVNNATGGNSGLVANGAGTGKGGHISLRLTDDITIGGAPGLVITAISTGSGNGGDVDIVTTQGSLVIDAGSINVNGGSDGKGGNITAKTLQSGSTLTVNGSLTANGQNTKKGGNIKVLAAGMLDIGMAQFHADGGPRGTGGSIELSAAGDLTINAGQVTALAGTLGSNKGGEISLTTTAGGKLTVNSDLKVNGAGNGQGGSLVLSSDGDMDLSRAALSANGGTNGDGGSISVAYKSSDELNVKDLSATGGSTNGGNIAIHNSASADALVNAAGKIDTSTTVGESLSGSMTLSVIDPDSFNVGFNLEETAVFMSLLSTTAKSVLLETTDTVPLTVDRIEATNGDVNFCGDGSCAAVLAARTRVIDSLDDPKPNLTVVTGGIVTAAQGSILATGKIIVISQNGALQAKNGVRINCTELRLGPNTALAGVEYSGDVTVTALNSDGLTIKANPGLCGIVQANQAILDGGTGPLTFFQFGAGGSKTQFALDCAGPGAVGRVQLKATMGQIHIPAEFKINADASGNLLTPCNVIDITADSLLLNSGSTVASVHRINITTTDFALIDGDLKTTNFASISADSQINIQAGTSITGLGDINVDSIGGSVSLSANGGDIGFATGGLHIGAAGTLTIAAATNAYLSLHELGGANHVINLSQTGAISGDLVVRGGGDISIGSALTAGGLLDLLTSGKVDVLANLKANGGYLAVVSQNDVVTLGSGFTSPLLQATGDTVVIAHGNSVSAVPGTQPSGSVTVVLGSAAVYWGNSPGITVTGALTVEPTNHNIIFQTNGSSGSVVVAGNVDVKAL